VIEAREKQTHNNNKTIDNSADFDLALIVNEWTVKFNENDLFFREMIGDIITYVLVVTF